VVTLAWSRARRSSGVSRSASSSSETSIPKALASSIAARPCDFPGGLLCMTGRYASGDYVRNRLQSRTFRALFMAACSAMTASRSSSSIATRSAGVRFSIASISATSSPKSRALATASLAAAGAGGFAEFASGSDTLAGCFLSAMLGGYIAVGRSRHSESVIALTRCEGAMVSRRQRSVKPHHAPPGPFARRAPGHSVARQLPCGERRMRHPGRAEQSPPGGTARAGP
jgi:hypothetical protein